MAAPPLTTIPTQPVSVRTRARRILVSGVSPDRGRRVPGAPGGGALDRVSATGSAGAPDQAGVATARRPVRRVVRRVISSGSGLTVRGAQATLEDSIPHRLLDDVRR